MNMVTQFALWLQGVTGLPPQDQFKVAVIWGMGAIHLSTEHEYGVLSACVLGMDKVVFGLRRFAPVFNTQIQAQLSANADRLAAAEAELKELRDQKKPAGTP